MRHVLDLAGYWDGRLQLDQTIDVAAPELIEQPFYLPLPWNLQVDHLRWPGQDAAISGVVRPVQNQNFRDVQRKFNEGIITYTRKIDLQARPGNVYLCCDGANYLTRAYVNGEHVGEHAGGHLAFDFDITAALEPGENTFQIIVDNRRRRDAAPQEQFNWQNYGGIYRPLRLEWRHEVHLRHCHVWPGRDTRGWFVDLDVRLNQPTTAAVSAQITSGSEVRSVDLEGTGATRRGRARLGNPLLWRVGEGGLSEVLFELQLDGRCVDERRIACGIRTVSLEGTRVVVNGEAIRILGAAMHEQHAAFGNSVPPWQADRDLRLMRHVGLNTIRTAHYPHAQSLYDACDRMGMLAIAELPCWQFNEWHFAQPTMRNLCVNYARDMVDQLGHHPSIIGWMVQNESHTFEPGAREFFESISNGFREADPTRFTMSAESPRPPEHLTVVKDQSEHITGELPPTHDVVDMLGINNYAGWYSHKADYFPRLLDHVIATCNGQPLMVTEFGGEGILGERSLAMHPWTEDYQAQLICHHIRAVLERPEIAGFILWLFADYECASIGIRGINAKGLVDEHRRPKLAFDAVKALLAAR